MTKQELEIMRQDVDRIFALAHQVPWEDHEAFLVSLAMADTIHQRKFGGDTGFAAMAEKSQRTEVANARARSKDMATKDDSRAKLSALAWRVHVHRLVAIATGEQELLDYINQKSAPLVALGLQATLEMEKSGRRL
jgi:hypothetical protein